MRKIYYVVDQLLAWISTESQRLTIQSVEEERKISYFNANTTEIKVIRLHNWKAYFSVLRFKRGKL